MKLSARARYKPIFDNLYASLKKQYPDHEDLNSLSSVIDKIKKAKSLAVATPPAAVAGDTSGTVGATGVSAPVVAGGVSGTVGSTDAPAPPLAPLPIPQQQMQQVFDGVCAVRPT